MPTKYKLGIAGAAMSLENPEIRLLTSSRDLDDYDILAIRPLSVAVPYKTTESLRKMIWGAMVTYAFGNFSVDHVLRRYSHVWDHHHSQSFEKDSQLLILRNTQEDIARIAEKLESTSISSKPGHLCARSALCRLEATFKAAYGLVRREYIFETEAVVRMLLEQLAWAHAAYSTDDEGLRTLNPTRCITGFKSVFAQAGKFYGELSEGAHIDPTIVENYLEFHGSGSKVIRRSAPDSQYSGYYLTALAWVYLKVVQKLFQPFSEADYGRLEQTLLERHRRYCAALNDGPIDA